MKILYEDELCLVLDKPEGVVVNRAESVKGETVQDWVEKNYGLEKKFPEDKLMKERTGLCHRLDKETSGCLLIAKTPEALRFFLKEFQERRVGKRYKALVHGLVEPVEGEVSLPLRRSILEREKWHVHYAGKKAVTRWKREKVYSWSQLSEVTARFGDKLSLLDIELMTGRTHQIRVHMSFLGWPLFSDERYLAKEVFAIDRSVLKRHFLHSYHLEFNQPDGKRVVVESELPGELGGVFGCFEA